MFRLGLATHWDLTNRIGKHQAQLRDALSAARLLGIEGTPDNDFTEVLASSNWAKHAPPPGSTSLLPMPPDCSGAVRAEALEHFRSTLYAQPEQVPEQGEEPGHPDRGAASVGEPCHTLTRTVETEAEHAGREVSGGISSDLYGPLSPERQASQPETYTSLILDDTFARGLEKALGIQFRNSSVSDDEEIDEVRLQLMRKHNQLLHTTWCRGHPADKAPRRRIVARSRRATHHRRAKFEAWMNHAEAREIMHGGYIFSALGEVSNGETPRIGKGRV